MRSFPEARPFLPIDLPTVRRLAPHGISFDSLTSLTRGHNTLEGAVWSAVPLADLGTPTFILRHDDQAYVSQFRHKFGEHQAYITFIAPALSLYGESAWLALIDAMTQAAGRRGAQRLIAEAEETGPAFAVLRQAGFAVYARQEIWKRDPAPLPVGITDVLRPATEQDAWGIASLYTSVVPRLVLQADAPPEPTHGSLVYEQDGQILGHIAIQEGKYGIYVQSLLHPESHPQARSIITSMLARTPRAEKLPVYWPVRRYQEWLQSSVLDLNFESWRSQAVMVKHTVCRIEHPVFKTAHMLEGVIPARTKVIDCVQVKRIDTEKLPAKEWLVDGISHNRRSGKAKSSSARLPGGLA